MTDVLDERQSGAAAAEHPEKRLSAVAAALHAEWSAALGTPRPGIEGAATVMEWVARRAGELGQALAGGSIVWGLLRPGGIAIFDDYGMFEDEAYGLQARAAPRARSVRGHPRPLGRGAAPRLAAGAAQSLS